MQADQGADMERYQGIVELKGKTIEECVAHYFEQSDHLSSVFDRMGLEPMEINRIFAAKCILCCGQRHKFWLLLLFDHRY